MLPGASFGRTLIPFMRFRPHSLAALTSLSILSRTRAISPCDCQSGHSPATAQPEPEHTPPSVLMPGHITRSPTAVLQGTVCLSLPPCSPLDTNSSRSLARGGRCKKAAAALDKRRAAPGFLLYLTVSWLLSKLKPTLNLVRCFTF